LEIELIRLTVLALLLLAACGVDGAPVAPQAAAPGVTLSGSVEAGVVFGSDP
jgi:hypothetical protein